MCALQSANLAERAVAGNRAGNDEILEKLWAKLSRRSPRPTRRKPDEKCPTLYLLYGLGRSTRRPFGTFFDDRVSSTERDVGLVQQKFPEN